MFYAPCAFVLWICFCLSIRQSQVVSAENHTLRLTKFTVTRPSSGQTFIQTLNFKRTFVVFIFLWTLKLTLFSTLHWNTGDISESDEMRPCWFNIDQVPFDQMWCDDKDWYAALVMNCNFEEKCSPLMSFSQSESIFWTNSFLFPVAGSLTFWKATTFMATSSSVTRRPSSTSTSPAWTEERRLRCSTTRSTRSTRGGRRMLLIKMLVVRFVRDRSSWFDGFLTGFNP